MDAGQVTPAFETGFRPVAVGAADIDGAELAENKENFTAYKLLIADVVDGKLKAVPRGVMAAGNVMQGSRGGVDLPERDIDRVKSHLAKYYAKMDDMAPWDHD